MLAAKRALCDDPHAMKAITFTPAAARQFKALGPDVRGRISAKLRAYAETGGSDVTRMRGSQAKRLRVGDFRVVFIETATTIDVGRVGHRREVYE